MNQKNFLERNLQLLKDKKRVDIILSKTYFHAPNQQIVRDFIFKHNIQFIIDLLHNTFRPHNNTKCIAIVIQKNKPQQNNMGNEKALKAKDILYIRR